jgi:gluconolactonase
MSHSGPSASTLEHYDPRFAELVPVGATLERLATGAQFAEGPVYMPADGAVIWSDVPGNRVMRWASRDGRCEVWRDGSNFTNGHTLDAEGRLVWCSHGARAVMRREHDGSVTVLAERWQGVRLNSPNDLVARPDGTIWFTDPIFGIWEGHAGRDAISELGSSNVYRFDPTSGELDAVITDVEGPNGLAFSPDGALLYVADSSAVLRSDGAGNHHIRVYDVLDGRHVRNGRLFAVIAPGIPDGFRVDVNGNVFTSSEDSIQVYDRDGVRLGKIHVPELVSNCCWGGAGRNRLFITATSSLFAITLNTTGAGLLW